jgi:hypothetical protein
VLPVRNVPPVAVDDTAATFQDTAVAIAVTANDRDPDGDDGYPTLVLEPNPPIHGTTQVRSDGSIVYRPDSGFAGRDTFQYSNCDDTINASGQPDCGSATVTVTVGAGQGATTSAGGFSSGGFSAGGSTGGGSRGRLRPDCLPSGGIGDLQVTPIKGTGGTELQITAKAASSLVNCQLRLLLGVSPFGNDLVIRPEATADRPRSSPTLPHPSRAARQSRAGGTGSGHPPAADLQLPSATA